MSRPLGFGFAVHIHQPVGNFDEVFREHVDHVYRPFLQQTATRGFRPLSLHVSGPLLDWLGTNDTGFLDEIGREVSDGRIELLGSGRTEPVLAALGRRDRLEQIEEMSRTLTDRFGATPTGLWLTERVWEQDLAGDLSEAGIEYALLDDRHFLSVGLTREELWRPLRTEYDGRSLDLLPIDERLRYLVPFESPGTIERFLRARHSEGVDLVVLGDDGEKFGGWPGTRAWVYDAGWLEGFLDVMERLRGDGTVELITTGEAAARDSGGLVYPAPGSYREMESWALPRAASLELDRLRESAKDGLDHPSIRGGHWRNFQTRYPVSNRMHKTALALSRLCRERGDPPTARAAIARAQCNDAYWHGVFGGVYLPHLRQAIWRELAAAEAELRAGEAIAASTLDIDFDGFDEVWVHGPHCSGIISTHRGGTVESLLRFETGENDLDILGRHFEAYHGDPSSAPAWSEVAASWSTLDAHADSNDDSRPDGISSIHDRDPPERPAPPAIDPHPPVLFRERITFGTSEADPSASPPLEYELEEVVTLEGSVSLRLSSSGAETRLTKRIEIGGDGGVQLLLEWDDGGLPQDAILWTEVWLAHERVLEPSMPVTETHEEIVTLARSEQGYEEIRQGEIARFGWPAASGRATLRLSAGG